LLKESLLVLAIIILFCFLVWLLKDTYPFSLLYGAVAPIITQLQTTAQSLLAGPLGLWQQAQTQIPQLDNIVSVGVGGGLIGAIIRSFYQKGETYLKGKLKNAESALKNHTSENATLKEANTQLQEKNETILSLTSDLQSGYEAGYEAKLKDLQDQLDAKDDQIQEEIRKRQAAERIDKKKIAEEIKDEIRKH